LPKSAVDGVLDALGSAMADRALEEPLAAAGLVVARSPARAYRIR
jgi:hypothetical protein